jgi:hypothetical protein
MKVRVLSRKKKMIGEGVERESVRRERRERKCEERESEGEVGAG